MKNSILKLFVLLLFTMVFSISSYSQEPANKGDTLRKGAARVFIDCESCDMNHIRQQIPYVNYVRDTREAQVYILVTQQDAGSGGSQYTFTFQGQENFKGMNDTLVYTSNPDETSAIKREKKTNLLKMGLMRYVARTPVFNEIEISHNSDLENEMVVDRWNNWVFEISASPEYRAEESDKRLQLENSIDIARITPDYKFQLEFNQDIIRRRVIDEDKDTTYVKSDNSIDMLFVKSLSEHWSAGLVLENGTSTEENYKFMTEIMPAIEYDFYPYSESTRRQLRVLYSAGFNYSKYIDSTVFKKTREHFFLHKLQIAYQVQEKWGSINVALSETNLLSDPSKNGIELGAEIRIRVIKGLSLSLNGEASYNNYQPNLRKGEVSEADRLLQLKQMKSSYYIGGGIRLTYTFGSIYNNVVNPRFGNH